MNEQQILDLNTTKTAKAKLLFDLGYTKRQVADLLMNGNVGFAYNVWKKWNENQATRIRENQRLNPFTFAFNRTFGIEIEAFGVSKTILKQKLEAEGIQVAIESYNHIVRNHWKITTDSSINGHQGFELVSPILQGQNGIDQLKKVCRALNKAKAKVNKSCGLHVHIGANDYTLDHFKNLVVNYINLEKQFDKMMPNSRRKNNNTYCKSITGYSKRQVKSKTSISGLLDMLTSSRYRKLNLKSFRTYGTAEFRHHSGTTSFGKIKNWIIICSRLIEFSQQGETNMIDTILDEPLKMYYYDRVEDLVA